MELKVACEGVTSCYAATTVDLYGWREFGMICKRYGLSVKQYG